MTMCSPRTFRLVEESIDRGFPFTFGRAFLDGEDFPYHAHDYSELVVMTGGEGLHDADGDTRLVHSGDVFVIHAGISHGFRSCEALSMFNFGFDPAELTGSDLVAMPGFHALFVGEPRLRTHGGAASFLRLRPDEMDALELDISRLEAELRDRKPGFAMVYRNLFINLAAALSRHYLTVQSPRAKSLVALSAGVAYLESGIAEEVFIGEAADRAGLSVNQFIRRFKAAYGLTPYRYLIGLRLDRAARLLTESNRSVTDIAADCGFDDANYFSRSFSARFGTSPRSYRSLRRR